MADTSLTETGPPPRSAGELFLVFAWISMQSFGGALTFIEKTVVRDKRWLSPTEFLGLQGSRRGAQKAGVQSPACRSFHAWLVGRTL